MINYTKYILIQKVKDEKKRDEYFKSLEEDKKNLHV